MDEILGVVRDHDVEAGAVVLFEKQHALVDPVEAVGFGSGSVVRADGQMDVREAGFQIADGVERRVVVRVGSDKEMIVAVVDGGGVVLHHAGDDGVLVPERDEDGDGLFASRSVAPVRLRPGSRAGAAGPRPRGRWRPKPGRPGR